MNGVTKSSPGATPSEMISRSSCKNENDVAAPPASTTSSYKKQLMVSRTASVWMNGVGMDDGLQICRFGGSAGEDFEIGASIIHFDVFDSSSSSSSSTSTSSSANASNVKGGGKKLSMDECEDLLGVDLDEFLQLDCGSGNVNANINRDAAATFTATTAVTGSSKPRPNKPESNLRSRQGIIAAIDSSRSFTQTTSASASAISFEAYGQFADGSSWMEHKEECTSSTDHPPPFPSSHSSKPTPPTAISTTSSYYYATDWNKCSFSARFLISTNRSQGGEEMSNWANLYHHGWLFKEHVQRDDFSAYLFPLVGTFDCSGAIIPSPDSNGDLHDLYFRRQEQHMHKIDSFGTGTTREEYIQFLMDENGLDLETATSFAVPDNEYKFGKCDSHRFAINKREKFGKAFVVCVDLTDKHAPRVIVTFLLLLVDLDLITTINNMEKELNACKGVSDICRCLAVVSEELSSAFDTSNANLIQQTFSSICF